MFQAEGTACAKALRKQQGDSCGWRGVSEGESGRRREQEGVTGRSRRTQRAAGRTSLCLGVRRLSRRAVGRGGTALTQVSTASSAYCVGKIGFVLGITQPQCLEA